mgnify:CR=1 FL=1
MAAYSICQTCSRECVSFYDRRDTGDVWLHEDAALDADHAVRPTDPPESS